MKRDSEPERRKMLTDSLRLLRQTASLSALYMQKSSEGEYSLSELGKSMRPIISAMEVWGSEYKKSYFGEALRLVTDTLDAKSFYAFNPSFDK